MRRFYIQLLFAFLLQGLIVAQEIDIRLYQKIQMRDSIHLSANIYLPDDDQESYPVILIYTPYVNDEAVDRGMYFAKEGFVFITLDLRGRGNSEGVFRPFEKDGIDGYDAIEWIAKQKWCDGNVGMMGGSYRGMVQWMTLKHKPYALKTIVPTASVGPGIDFPKVGGIFGSYALQWLNFTDGKGRNDNLFRNSEYWSSKSIKRFKELIPFRDWDLLAFGDRNPVFQKWIEHPEFDEYWQSFYPTEADYISFDLPILTITGYFDGDQPGAMTYYDNHMLYGHKKGISKHHIIFGPWGHAGTRKPQTEYAGMTFGSDSKLDMNQLHLDWFNWILKDGEKPEILKDRVNYYMMEGNDWRHVNQIKEMTNDTMVYYLSSPDSEAKQLIQSGSLSMSRPDKIDQDNFIYNPLDTIMAPIYQGKDWYMAPLPIDQKQGLIYISEPLQKNIEFAGRFEIGLQMSMNVPDTDLQTALYSINELGESRLVGYQNLRMRYRNGIETSELVVPGEAFFCKFDLPYITALEIEKESRFAITISAINSPRHQKNFNSGKDVSKETKEDAKVATISVHHSGESPSYLKIPIKLISSQKVKD